MVVVMRGQGATLVNTVSPHGIIDLEFAGTVDRYNEITSSWQRNDMLLNMYLDFLFIIAYTLFFLACYKSGKHYLKGNSYKVFRWLAITAAMMDVAENVFLLIAMHGKPSNFLMQAAGTCAGIKFLLVIFLAIWLLYIFMRFLYFKLRNLAQSR